MVNALGYKSRHDMLRTHSVLRVLDKRDFFDVIRSELAAELASGLSLVQQAQLTHVPN